MKRILLLTLFSAVLLSCQQASTPKETAQSFIKSLAASDLTTASTLVSEDTKPLLAKAGKEAKPVQKPEESFQLNSLTETIDGERAEVKNDVLSLNMVKEKEGWKVVMEERLLQLVQEREQLLSAAEEKWKALQKEYEGRMLVAQAYVDYKKTAGTVSQPVLQLMETLSSINKETVLTGEKLQAYVQQQQHLAKVLDAALEPSTAANTDLTMNYFLQISSANDRIKAAEAAYQSAAEKAHSPVYVPLPTTHATGPKVNQN